MSAIYGKFKKLSCQLFKNILNSLNLKLIFVIFIYHIRTLSIQHNHFGVSNLDLNSQTALNIRLKF